jgi:hypothetical protein
MDKSVLHGSENRRRFSRVKFGAHAFLEAGGRRSECELVDLSLKGSLVDRPEGQGPPEIEAGAACALILVLEPSEITIRMDSTVVHAHGGKLGLRCEKIDVDSLGHLRRLLELNLGDAELVDREFHQLVRHPAVAH